MLQRFGNPQYEDLQNVKRCSFKVFCTQNIRGENIRGWRQHNRENRECFPPRKFAVYGMCHGDEVWELPQLCLASLLIWFAAYMVSLIRDIPFKNTGIGLVIAHIPLSWQIVSTHDKINKVVLISH